LHVNHSGVKKIHDWAVHQLAVPLVLDLLIDNDRFGSSADSNLNGHLHYPNDMGRSLNRLPLTKLENIALTILLNNNPPNAISFIPDVSSTSGRLHSEFERLLFLQTHRETGRFFATSGVQLAQHDRDQFHYRRAAFSSILKSKCDSKVEALRITLNIDGAPIVSQTQTHPSHSQTSRLLTSSLSLGVPVPRTTQCM
jgi:hypothetical protein